MLRWQIRILRTIYLVFEFIALGISMLLATNLAYQFFESQILQSPLETYVFLTVTYLCYIFFFMLVELYTSFLRSKVPINAMLTLKTAFAFIPGHLSSYLLLVYFFHGYPYIFHILHAALFFAISILIKMLLYTFRKNAGHAKRNVLLIGQSANGKQYFETIQKYAYLHYNIIGFIHVKSIPRGYPSTNSKNGERSTYYSLDDCIYGSLPHLGGLEDLDRIVSTQVVDELVVTRPLSYDNRLENALKDMQKRGITITMLLNRLNINTANAIVSMIDDIPALKFHTVSLDESQLMAKRMLDIVGALVGLVIFGITWLVFAPIIKLESKGPVLFKQARVGKNGRLFMMWKFRSMIDGADALKKTLQNRNEMQGHMFKMADDPRVTRIGRIMRKTNIDELPQFYNVLIGDMSLVGTRPPTVEEVKEYQTHHYKRISIIPGITGLWQVSGGNKISDFEEVVRLDDKYIQGWSVWKDIIIIAKTLKLCGLQSLKICQDVSYKVKEKVAPHAYPNKNTQISSKRVNVIKALSSLKLMMTKSFRQ